MHTHQTQQYILLVILLLSLFAFGGFFEFTCAICSILLSGLLLFTLHEQHNTLTMSPSVGAVCVLPLCYLISTLVAVDTGMNLVGMVKFFPLIPCVFIVSSMKTNDRV